MDISDIETDTADRRRARGKKPSIFNWEINFGHVAIVLSLFLSAAGLYAHDEARISVIESRVDDLTSQNLPPRMAAAETQLHDIHDSMKEVTNLLGQIHNDLSQKADKPK